MSINEELSFTEYTLTEDTTDFIISFDRIGGSTDEVSILVNNTPIEDLVGYTVLQVNFSTWQVDPALPAGTVVRLARTTNLDKMVYVFTAGSKFIAKNVDDNFKQIQHSQQEIRDRQDKLEGDATALLLEINDVKVIAEQAAEDANEALVKVDEILNTGVVPAGMILTNSGQNQQQVNDFGGAKWYAKVGGYDVGATVKLTNGDIVRSSIPNNTNDPNIDMTGWRFADGALESIAEMLSIPNPKNGMRVFVKSYYHGNGVGYLGEATPYKGGNWFIYKSGRSAENDGVFIFNGWERFLDSDVYSPYMSGCACDGVTDDTQKFDKLNYALQYTKLKGRIVIDKNLFINSELPRTGNMQFVDPAVKCGVRLVSGVHIEILEGASIKVGSYFNDSATFVFCGANPSSVDDYSDVNPQKDAHLFGAGTIDSTQAGSMATSHGLSRYLIFLGGLQNFHMHGLTTIGGDYANIIVGRRKASGARIYNNHFKDTLVTGSFSQDHSTIWSPAPDWKVYNNRFTDVSPKAQIMSCAFESHGNEHYFYNNTVDNHLVAVLQCSYRWDLANQPTKDNMFIYGNTANSWFFLTFWFQGGDGSPVRPFGFMDCFDNTHNVLPYISKETLVAQGVRASIVDVRNLFRRGFASSSASIAKDYEIKVSKAQQFRNNNFYASFSPECVEQFFDMRILFNQGIHIFDNFMKTPRLFDIQNQFADIGVTTPMVISNYIWKNNTVDYSGVREDQTVSELRVTRMNNCHFDVNINASYPASLPSNKMINRFACTDPDNTKNNTIRYTTDGNENIDAAANGLLTILNDPFYANNSITIDTKSQYYLQPDTTNPKIGKFYSPSGSSRMRSAEILKYPKNAFGTFIPPTRVYTSSNLTGQVFYGVAHDFSMANVSTTLMNASVHTRQNN